MELTVQVIRDLVSDIDTTDPYLPDSSYQTIIDLGETNAYRAAAVACRQLSALFSPKVNVKAGSVSVANSDKSEAYRLLSTRYDILANQGLGETGDDAEAVTSQGYLGTVLTGVSLTEMKEVFEDEDRFPSSFVTGQDDNPGTERNTGRN